jgi:hypothetical protein
VDVIADTSSFPMRHAISTDISARFRLPLPINGRGFGFIDYKLMFSRI